MHKIYSRPRLKIPKVTNKKMKMIKIFLVLTIAFCTVKIVLDAVLPIFDTLCENKAKAIATVISNEQATNVMKEHSYDELFSIEKDEKGNVSMIKTNVIPINEIVSDIAVRIQKKLDEQGRENIQIALGSFTGFKLLAGKGPGIKIRISSIRKC